MGSKATVARTEAGGEHDQDAEQGHHPGAGPELGAEPCQVQTEQSDQDRQHRQQPPWAWLAGEDAAGLVDGVDVELGEGGALGSR